MSITQRKVETVNRSALAKDLGLNRSYVSTVLNGKAEPSLSTAKSIAKALGVSLGEFCEHWEGLRQAQGLGQETLSVN